MLQDNILEYKEALLNENILREEKKEKFEKLIFFINNFTLFLYSRFKRPYKVNEDEVEEIKKTKKQDNDTDDDSKSRKSLNSNKSKKENYFQEIIKDNNFNPLFLFGDISIQLIDLKSFINPSKFFI